MNGYSFSTEVFDFDVPAVTTRIEGFIAEQMTALGRAGIVVALSGGLDSSAVLALCARAVGPERVTALLLPDKRGSREAEHFSRLVTDRLKVHGATVDTSRVNEATGVYDFIGYRLPLPKVVARVVRAYLAKGGQDGIFLAGLRGTDHDLTRQALAAIYARQRLRMVLTYRYADLHRLLVVGSAHMTEDLLGLFVKFGIDDAADVMPLKGLYRTQVLRVAKEAGVPSEVLARTPNPEMLPGIDDKYLDIFGVPAPTVDLVLWGIQHALADAEIAHATDLDVVKAAELREAVRLSAHMRQPSRQPDLSTLLH